MSGTFGILLFAFAILASIGLHEFGHFITAKRFGIKVEQFFIGFGPRLWSVRKGETEYGVKALPLGGYVRIAGMNPFEEIAEEDKPRIFKAKKPWQRAIVLGAGSFTHFVLAIAIVTVVLVLAGQTDYDRPTTTVRSVTAGSPAATVGIRPGDAIVAIDDRRVGEWKEAVDLIRARGGKTAAITVRRQGRTFDVATTIAPQKPDGTKVGFLGVAPDFFVIERGVFSALGESGKLVGRGVTASLSALKDLFSPSSIRRLFAVASGEEERQATDPTTLVGVGDQAGDLAREGDFASVFMIIAGFNVFIGIANLLPLPPLDGGHLAVLAYEKLTRREVDMRRLIPVTVTVISLFGSMFLLLLYLDIVRPLPSLG